MECLDENRVLEYVGGLLSDEERRAIEAHIAGCDDCRWMLSAAGAAVLDDVPTGEATWSAAPQGGRSDDLSVARRVREVLNNTYVIERFIGMGGVGLVYEAAHLRLPRRFAIKVLYKKWASDPTAIARFQREAEVTSRLLHPNIVEVVDFNYSADGAPFVAMELLRGESLAQRLGRDGTVASLSEVASIVRQVASGLSAAHASGVVHRDLKPSNIFLCASDAPEPLIKILDFGVAKVLASYHSSSSGNRPVTSVRAVMGTPAYMSAEQASGRSAEVDHRADIFSLGAIVFRMVAGARPFPGATSDDVIDRVARSEPVETASWRAAPAELRRVVLRAMSKDPAQRQQSVDELWRDVAAATTPVKLEEKAPRRARRRFRVRHAVALVAAVALGGALLWLSGRPSDEPRTDGARKGRAQARQSPPVDAARPLTAVSPASLPDSTARGRRDPAGQQHPMVPAAAARPHRPARRGLARSAAAGPAGRGSMIIQSKDREDGKYVWADVYLDGVLVGQTALMLANVAPGSHHLEARRSGYDTARRDVKVAPGKRAVVRFELARRRSPLSN